MDEIDDTPSDKTLKNLIEEFMIAGRLEQYDDVSRLCSSISTHLVESIDASISRNDSDLEEAESEDKMIDNDFRQFIEQICKKLGYIGQLASAYQDLCQFVRLQDLNSLAKIIGALKPEQTRSDILSSYGVLIKVVRQSIILLRSMSQKNHDEWDLASRSGFIDGRKIDPINPDRFLEFPLCEITNFQESLVTTQTDDDHILLADQLEDLKNEQFPNEDLRLELKSQWFSVFVQNHLDKNLPLDRFTLLIAIWIAGVASQCTSLDSIMNELVDGLIHEEAVSSSVEDFMQLSQLGSIWLSERRRLSTTTTLDHKTSDGYSSSETGSSDSDESEREFDDDAANSSSSSNQSKQANNSTTNDSKYSHQGGKNLKRELKQLIEGSFLHGYRCPICGDKQSGKLLAILEQDSCANCSSQLLVERCSLSFRPIPIVRLDSIIGFRAKARTLTLISGSQWLRYYLKEFGLFGLNMVGNGTKNIAILESSLGNHQVDKDQVVGEKLEIAEDFQKLTVIRPDQDNSDSGSNSDDDHDEESAKSDAIMADDVKMKEHSEEPWFCSQLKSMMRKRRVKQLNVKQALHATNDDKPSESLQMIGFAQSDATNLILNMCDLLIMEPIDNEQVSARDRVRIGLLVSDSWRRWGPIMSCSSRSQVSHLQLGCGRLFFSVELLKTNQATAKDGLYTCPDCSLDLIQLTSLNNNMMN